MRGMFRSWVLATVCMVAAGVATPGGSRLLAAGGDPNRNVFRSGVELVVLNVVVTDTRRQFVDGLQETDFAVLEDGVPQQIAFFASGHVPLDLVLLIDTSSSMSALRPAVQAAASGFLSVLRPEDRAAIVGFNERVTVLQELTGDTTLLVGGIRRAGAHGNTSLFTSLYVVLRDFGRPPQQTSEVRRQAIVVITDGEENTSALGLEALLEEARARGVAVYAIMMQTEELRKRERIEGRLRPARAGIKQVALETGALAYFPQAATDLDGIYQSIAAELTHQYSLAYLPPSTGRDGLLRQIAVRILSRPALKARARTTYLPGGPALRVASR